MIDKNGVEYQTEEDLIKEMLQDSNKVTKITIHPGTDKEIHGQLKRKTDDGKELFTKEEVLNILRLFTGEDLTFYVEGADGVDYFYSPDDEIPEQEKETPEEETQGEEYDPKKWEKPEKRLVLHSGTIISIYGGKGQVPLDHPLQLKVKEKGKDVPIDSHATISNPLKYEIKDSEKLIMCEGAEGLLPAGLDENDKQVLEAVFTSISRGDYCFTTPQLYYCKTGKRGTSEKVLSELEESLWKQNALRIKYDFTKYAEYFAEKQKISYDEFMEKLRKKTNSNGIVVGREESLLHLRKETLDDGREYWKILDTPPLYTCMMIANQFTKVDMELFSSPLRSSDLNDSVNSYLVERITSERNHCSEKKKKSEDPNDRKFDLTLDKIIQTCVEKSENKATNRKNKQKVIEAVEKVLAHWVEGEKLESFKKLDKSGKIAKGNKDIYKYRMFMRFDKD